MFPNSCSLSPARVCVTLSELSVCRELRPALLSALLQTARLFPDACHRTRCCCSHDRYKLRPTTHPDSRERWVKRKCWCRCKCAFMCVCVSSHLRTSVSACLYLSVSSLQINSTIANRLIAPSVTEQQREQLWRRWTPFQPDRITVAQTLQECSVCTSVCVSVLNMCRTLHVTESRAVKLFSMMFRHRLSAGQ